MANIAPQFTLKQYLFRRKVFKLFGGAFHVYDAAGQVIMYSKQKAFKLKEDIRIYTDETMKTELLAIQTPQILDLWARYNIKDSVNGETPGSVKRKALMSILQDEWAILTTDGIEIGKMIEENLGMAILSRLLPLVPQKYVIKDMAGRIQARVRNHFNPFILKYTMQVEDALTIDRRLIVACGILLCAIERRED
jgi:uncharacterized protein YxjI